MMKRLLAVMCTAVLMITMMTSCGGEENLASPDKNTIGNWSMTTEQEDVYEKMSVLLGVEGQFYQFNSEDCNLELYAYHYVDGKLVDDGLMASYAVDGDGYMYIDYRDSDDMKQEMTDEDEPNTATITTSILTNSTEDGTTLQFQTNGIGSIDSIMTLLNTDDAWTEDGVIPIEYEKEFDLWGINLSEDKSKGELQDSVEATKKSWMEGECLIITAKFTAEDNSDAIKGENLDVEEDDGSLEDFGEPLPDQPSEEQIKEIMQEIEEAESEND